MNSFKKRTNFLPYCLPSITGAEIAQVAVVLQSGWLAKGPESINFEEQFAQYIGAKYAVAMNSCTAALHISLLAAGIGPSDEVITTPMTFAATANTIIHTGATPVFADIDPETGCIDPDEMEKKVTVRTKAIVPVHYSGQACDLDRIYAIAERYGLFVSEDAAHAIYTRYKGRMIGSTSKGTVSFSFYATKNICTGEGGMLLTDNGEIARQARILSTHGMNKNAWNRYAKGGKWQYDIEQPGYKYNMCDLQAALGRIQLERLSAMQKRREQIAAKYNASLQEAVGLKIPMTAASTTTHSWHLYPVTIISDLLSISRNRFIEELNRRNVGTSVHFIPLHLMSTYSQRFGFREGDFPKAEKWFDGTLSLPLYPAMTDDDVAYVIAAVQDILDRYRQ